MSIELVLMINNDMDFLMKKTGKLSHIPNFIISEAEAKLGQFSLVTGKLYHT